MRRALPLCCLLGVATSCDTTTNPLGLEATLLSIEEVVLPDLLGDGRDIPGLSFVFQNTGPVPIHTLRVRVRPEPFDNTRHSAQNVIPTPVGDIDTLTVPLLSRASHDDYECYTYVYFGDSDPPGPPGTGEPVEYKVESDGTCG